MTKSDAAFSALMTGALTIYLAGAFAYCSLQDSTLADRALTRGAGVALGGSALVFFCYLMRYLNLLTKRPDTTMRESSQGATH